MSEEHVLHAELEVKDCVAELYVNGIPVRRLGPDTQPRATHAVQHYLIPGTNEIELLVEPGPTPSVARTKASQKLLPKASAVARLIKYPDGAFPEPENGETLAEVHYRGKTDYEELFPKSFIGQAEIGAAFGRWSWQDAPDLVLDEATVKEALAVIKEAEMALRSGSVDAVMAVIEISFKECWRAYPANEEKMLRAEMEAFLGSLKSVPEPILPADPARIDFRLVARDKILECIDKDWETSLRLVNEEGLEVPYSLLLARIGGRLRVVR
jgi:hypothetical protein